jgi:hypothetical protein
VERIKLNNNVITGSRDCRVADVIFNTMLHVDIPKALEHNCARVLVNPVFEGKYVLPVSIAVVLLVAPLVVMVTLMAACWSR